MAAPVGPGRSALAAPDRLAPIPVAVFGKDERGPLPERLQRLKGAIGLVFNNEARTVCSGFCVAPDVILTASHCLFHGGDRSRRSLSSFWFALDRKNGRAFTQFSGHGNGTSWLHVMSGTVRLKVKPPIDAVDDWAAVRLAKPVCQDDGLPIKALSGEELAAEAAAGHLFQVAYHRDYKEWELAYSQGCEAGGTLPGVKPQTVRRDFTAPEGLILHKCDTGEASSGGPILIEGADGPFVVGINVGTYVQSRVLLQNGRVTKRFSPHMLANTAVNLAMIAERVRAFGTAEVATSEADLRQFQTRLKAMALYAGPVDGDYGELTRAAIIAYERAEGLPETGLPTRALAERLAGGKRVEEIGDGAQGGRKRKGRAKKAPN